ncbi:MAG TPA: NAD(P)H-binding protein [Spirochaetia bacterium]|nr:NAD(P)H-binding protein [Spirochaetia bacterium]
MLVVVFGATGNTGREVCRSLSQKADVRIRAVSRNPSGASGLPAHEVRAVTWTERSQLRSALEGADAAYFMLPTGLHNGSLFEFRDAYSRSFVELANDVKLKRVVSLSSFGAHLAEKSGVLKGLCQAEKNLQEFAGEAVIIRPGYFWQNFAGNVSGIKEKGFFGGYPVDLDVSLLFAHTADIGSAAAELLTAAALPFHRVLYVGHRERATFREVSSLIAEKSGRKGLMWTNVGYDAARSFMLGRGMPAEIVGNLIEFFEAINTGRAMDDFTPDRLIPTPIGKAEFAAWFAGQIGSG